MNVDIVEGKDEGKGKGTEPEFVGDRGAEAKIDIVDSSMGSLNGSVENGEAMKKELPLRGMEAKFAGWSPSAYAAMRTALDFVPFGRYAIPSEREDFLRLDQEEQTQALLWESLGAAMWGVAPRLGKDIGYVARMGGKGIEKALGWLGREAKAAKVLPYEDAVAGIGKLTDQPFRPFVWAEEAKTRLANRGFGKDEAEAVVESLTTKSDDSLINVILDRKMEGKGTTKAFRKATFWETARTYPKRKLRNELVEEFGEDVLRGKFYEKQFENALAKDVFKIRPKKKTTEGIFRAHLERTFPDLAKEGKGFGDLTPHQMANVTLDMLGNKVVAWQVQHPTLLATLKPARVVMGYGERGLGTFNGIYKPLKASLGRMNRNYFNHMLLFGKMLEQRGLGKVVVKESGEFIFKRAKWLDTKTVEEAYGVMLKMDELSMQAQRAGTKETRGMQEAIGRLGKEASPGAKALIETMRTYFDHLYGEHVKLQIPRVFRKAKLSRLGRAKIDEMLTGPNGLNYQVDRLFSTMGKKDPVEKISGMKKILEGVRGKLESPVPGRHPYFEEIGKELEKTLTGLGKELSWGRKGFLRYLDNYVARVSKHEDSLLQKWRGGLFKEQSAFYTKLRQLEKMKGAPVDFSTMVSARTMAHAKEHFLYDKLGEVVRFTEGLPPAWIEYVEGWISGILSVPSIADYKVAQFLSKTVGGLARFVGKEGLWNEQRVTNLAYTINNLTYLGGLGFKPFSAARNLFQPLLTVPADLGGVKDLGKLVEGYRWAFNPKNRAWIRSIGAITEYAPEIHLRPNILRTGLGGKIEQTRDVAMWMFRGSDRFNRYVTGGAASLKWERALGKFERGLEGNLRTQDVKGFGKVVGLDRRYEWIRGEVEDLLYRGRMDEAKATFIRDVIADTQYLYGTAEAPSVIRKHGGLGRTAFVFQSWWMNYGTLLQKWLTTGASPGAKAERVLTMMLAQSMAYAMMKPMWGKVRAQRGTFLGPFPGDFNEFLLPPSWAPVYHAGRAVMSIQNPSVSSRHAKAVLDSSMIFLPGGLQMKSFLRGSRKEGWKGFSKAILGIHKEKKKKKK